MSYKRVDMAIDIQAYLDEDKKLNPSEHLSLIVMARYCDDEGGSCFPGIPRLCSLLCLKRRQVQNIMHVLESRSLIHPDSKTGGRGKSTHYTLTFPDALIIQHQTKHLPRHPTKIVKSHLDQFDLPTDREPILLLERKRQG